MKFLTPQGIGDVTWALAKVQSIAKRIGVDIDMAIACNDRNELQTRSLEYVRRFPFVRSAEMVRAEVLRTGAATDEKGRWRYIDDGPIPTGELFSLMPNACLERGERLEKWFPQDEIDWTITRNWKSTEAETTWAKTVESQFGPFAIVYPGPESGNTREGHNRNSLWKPFQWIELAQQIREMGLIPIAIGASYDFSFWKRHVLPVMKSIDPTAKLIVSFVGQTSIGRVLALIRRARFGIYYQSGLGVWSAFEGIPTAMFWRPEGDSAHPSRLISFNERMASAWVPPEELKSERYLPCVYTKISVDGIAHWAKKWAQ